MNNSQRISTAVETTQRVAPGHFEGTLDQRSALQGACGSVYDATPEQILEMLLAAEWEEYSHPAVKPRCTAFKAPIPGQLGVVALTSLPEQALVRLEDPKHTKCVSAVVQGVRGEEVDFTVLILGLEQGEEVVFTFHPGAPVAPSEVPAEGLDGMQVTVKEALAMGLKTAKISG